MFCPRCGTVIQSEHKFCKSCGAPIGVAGSAPAGATPATPPAAASQPAALPASQAAYHGQPAPPPGMVPVVYQAYPGGPQQIYYVPAHGMHAQTGGGLLEGIREKIRDLASTDKLEGFSLSQTFSQAFSHHGADAIEEYMMVGSARTTPPLESVETGWPRPWMFFRLLLIFAIISVACYFDWKFAQDPTMISALLIMGAFAVPVSTLVLIFEMNTPRNVSMVVVGNLFVIGGLFGLGAVAFEYMIPIAGKIPGIVEETAKFAAVLLVMRSLRYKYQLNGILFGAAVGAGFAAFETAFYGLSMSFLPAFVQALIQSNGQELTAYNVGMQAMASNLLMRGVLAPFGHVAWTAIAAGAFWRVKQDKPATLAMLTDTRFLKAFLIPVALHSLWDIGLDFPNSALINSTLFQISDYVLNGLTSWFVLFGLIQQGLHQVRNEQKSQLQSTLVHVEATLGLGARNYAMQPQSQAGD